MNKAILIGRLGADPIIRSTEDGRLVANLALATSQRWIKDNERHEHTEWHKIVVWGQKAEFCQKYLRRGRLVSVEGRIQRREWIDSFGTKKHQTEILAQNIEFVGLDPKKAEYKTPPEGDV